MTPALTRSWMREQDMAAEWQRLTPDQRLDRFLQVNEEKVSHEWYEGTWINRELMTTLLARLAVVSMKAENIPSARKRQ